MRMSRWKVGNSDYKMIEFKNLRGRRKESNGIRTLDFRKANFNKLREFVGKIPWEASLKEKRSPGKLAVFKEALLRVQEQSPS